MNNPNIEFESKPILETLEAARAIVCTFTVENPTCDTALSANAVITMLRGVSTLLEEATDKKHWPTTLVGELETERKDSELPETWMYQPADYNTLHIDLLGTICCRAQGVIAFYIALGSTEDGFDKVSKGLRGLVWVDLDHQSLNQSV